MAAGLGGELGLDFEPEDIAMTQGAFGAIALALALVADAGDEVIIPVPGWFCYDPMLHAANLVPVAAALDPTDFSLDIDAIARAITPRTRVVIVNSPSNPTGRVFPKETWDELAAVLERHPARTAAGSGCSPTSRIGGSASTGSGSPVRRGRTHGR